MTAIAAGDFHSVALRSDGTVVAWGYNGSGQTNVPAGLSGVTAIAAGFAYGGPEERRHRRRLGYNSYGQANVPAGLTQVTAIAAGGLITPWR